MSLHHVTSLLAVSFMLLGPAMAQNEQRPLIERKMLTGLEAVTRRVAAAGMSEQVVQLHSVLRELGLPDDEQQKLAALTAKAIKRCRSPKDRLPAASERLRTTARQLAKPLETERLTKQEKTRLANCLLKLDGDNEAARRMLGFERIGSDWLTPVMQSQIARQEEIGSVLQRARRIPVKVEASISNDPLVVHALGRPGTCVRFGKLEVHSSWPEPRLRRIVQSALRAMAVSNWLVRGRLALPKRHAQEKWILLRSQAEYRRGVNYATSMGFLKGEAANVGHLGGFFGYQEYVCEWTTTEPDTTALLVARLAHFHVIPCITAGHINWLCQAAVGTHMPYFVYPDTTTTSSSRNETAGRVVNEEATRREMLRLREAGLLGSRSWMKYLALRRQDPPLSRTYVANIGKLGGDELCKSTIVMDYLHQSNVASNLLLAVQPKSMSPEEQAGFLTELLKEAVPAFEQRWRNWLCGEGVSIAKQLGDSVGATESKEVLESLEHLNNIRVKAFEGAQTQEVLPVSLDANLSNGAAQHANYLARNRKQLAAWPDAHEEYADNDAFTPEGCWAGLHSVIAPGVRSPTEAIDDWMGTFYHRLPLLETGLLRVGVAQHKDIAVMDTNSLRRPRDHMSVVVWPHNQMRDVPTRFVPELPNPIPGASQSKWGYPITVQLGQRAANSPTGVPQVSLALRRGTETSDVPCHLISPVHPKNEKLAPAGCWALIPKRHLKKNTTYHLTIELKHEKWMRVISFQT
jgi:hypothetical protein